MRYQSFYVIERFYATVIVAAMVDYIASTTAQLISLTGNHVIQWIFFVLCLLAFAVRAYIRLFCFRRLLFEDWLMVAALACHLAVAVLGQLYLVDMYALISAEHGGPVGSDFFSDALHGLKAFGTMCLLSITGIWLIKLNFLLFFYRLGHQIRVYRILWWAVLIFTVGCGAGCYGLVQYPCMFGDVETVFVKCGSAPYNRQSYIHVIMTAVLDIVSDFTILCFPIFILWNVKISLHKKLVLTAVFGLVGLTIAVTIVRASIFSPQYKAINGGSTEEVNICWVIFWFYVEFTVAFIIACIVSFRTLFIHKEQQQSDAKKEENKHQQAADHMQRKKSFLERMQRLRDSVLDTCRTWEGAWDDSDLSLLRTFRLPQPPSGRLSVDFSRDDGTSFSQSASKNSGDDSPASKTLV